MNVEDLANRFAAHDTQSEGYDMIRRIAFAFALNINELVPDGREKSLAISSLEEVVFWANAGIARSGNATEEGQV